MIKMISKSFPWISLNKTSPWIFQRYHEIPIEEGYLPLSHQLLRWTSWLGPDDLGLLVARRIRWDPSASTVSLVDIVSSQVAGDTTWQGSVISHVLDVLAIVDAPIANCFHVNAHSSGWMGGIIVVAPCTIHHFLLTPELNELLVELFKVLETTLES